MVEEGKGIISEDKEDSSSKESPSWKHDNDIMQNFAQHLLGPLKQLREGLIEERTKLIKQRNDWKAQNLDG